MNVAMFPELLYILNFDEVCFHSKPLQKAFLQDSGAAWCILWGTDPLLSGYCKQRHATVEQRGYATRF
jgi:hypothetical protein